MTNKDLDELNQLISAKEFEAAFQLLKRNNKSNNAKQGAKRLAHELDREARWLAVKEDDRGAIKWEKLMDEVKKYC